MPPVAIFSSRWNFPKTSGWFGDARGHLRVARRVRRS
jgi:hypothetical protein